MSASTPIVSTVTFGTSGATPISGNLTADPAQWNATYVTLSANYSQNSLANMGFPVGVPGQLDGTPNTNRGSYTNGQRAQFWACEAAALVAAGVGVYS